MKAVVQLCGGLGNQLFCYAFGLSQARKYDAELWIDTSLNDNGLCRNLEILDMNIEFDNHISMYYSQNKILRRLGYNWIRRKMKIGWNTKIYKVEDAFISYKEIPMIKSTFYRGYWQNYRFFDSYKKDIRKMLTQKYEVESEYLDLKKRMLATDSVAIHIRRGDYLKNGWGLSMDYYIQCLNQISQLSKHIEVYIFSDDIDFCKKEFQTIYPNAIYPSYKEKNKTIDDMLLMSNCRYMIIANSTYSWWAAYINSREDSVIFCPIYKEWGRNFYPDNWISLEA